MQALSNTRREPVGRPAQIVPFSEFKRVRSLRVLAQACDAPDEAHPWAYVFPRAPVAETVAP